MEPCRSSPAMNLPAASATVTDAKHSITAGDALWSAFIEMSLGLLKDTLHVWCLNPSACRAMEHQHLRWKTTV